MPEAIWIDQSTQLPELAKKLQAQPWVGLDTEFLRERTFFPKLCLLQLSAGDQLWCVDTLRVGSLEPLLSMLTAVTTPKLIHAARQDLEAIYLTTQHIVSPVFDTQIAAACLGLKPQIGYAELVKTLLDVTIPKGQTRTDWSKRPLSREQLDYAADDVLYLAQIAAIMHERLSDLNRDEWVREDCLSLEQRHLYEPDPSLAWVRVRGIAQLASAPRLRAKRIAVWRERFARERDLPRAWILADPALFAIALANPQNLEDLQRAHPLNDKLAAALLEALQSLDPHELEDHEPPADLRPTPEQKALLDRLSKIVDARAAELNISAEVLAPRGELKAMAMGRRDLPALSGWRQREIGERLLEIVG